MAKRKKTSLIDLIHHWDTVPRKSYPMYLVILMLLFAACGCVPPIVTEPTEPPPVVIKPKGPPPLKTTVIVNDMKPPKQGCELLALHAFNECRNGTWHVVTMGTFQCGQTQQIKEVHVVRTNQPCKAGDTPPSIQRFIPNEIPNQCVAPVKLYTYYQLECPQNQNWNWIAYDRMQCNDGRLYTRRNHSFDRVTLTPCTQPRPSSPLGN